MGQLRWRTTGVLQQLARHPVPLDYVDKFMIASTRETDG